MTQIFLPSLRPLSRRQQTSLSVIALALMAAPLALPAQAQTAPAKPAPAKPAQSQTQTQSQSPAQTQTQSQTPAGGTTPSGGDDSGAITTVTVTAAKPEVQHKPDRDVYDVTQDPDAATGSAADVMNNIPAVTVDPDGTVSLRGDSNVQVYVNGKPSAQMQGDNRGPQLQTMSADDIDSIEVMTNPSAAFGADTGGGIINIVLKKGRHIKPKTSMNVTVGDEGRYGFGIRSGKSIGKLTLNGSLNLRSDTRKNGSHSDRQRIDPVTGETRDSTQDNVSNTRTDNLSANLTAEYDMSDYDSLTGELNYSQRKRSGYNASEYANFDTTGNPVSDYAQIGSADGPSDDSGAKLTYDHRGKDSPDDDFKIQLGHSETNSKNDNDYRQIYHYPVTPDSLYARRNNTKNVIDDFSGDWTKPLKDNQQIQTGWDIQHTVSDTYNYRSYNHADGAAELANPTYTNQFNVDQTISAAYFIYQKTWGKFGIQGGLRAEKLHEELNQVTSNIQATVDYVTWSPSVFATYTISDADLLRLSYSHKIVRPGANLLNPFLSYGDAQNVSSGNPYLQPEQVENYELTFNHDKQALNSSASLFYKTTRDNFSRASTFVNGQSDVLLTTSINDGSLKSMGLQFSLNDNIFNRTLRLGLNGVLGYSVQDATDYVTHLPTHRESGNSSANLFARWAPDRLNAYMIRLNYRGKQLLSQGYRTGTTSLNLSYQRQIIPNKLMLNFSARDVLKGQGSRSVTDTSTVQSVSENFDYGAAFMMSLRYTFGAVPQARPDDDRGPRPGGRGGYGGHEGGGGGYGGGGGEF
ncbi:TonB-dependent receptor [Asticcacaulis sp. EMRT-3]|uniref:TonB-dependent receptor domain-containing protein n=1 Tax=Asticcacaulis sp. EMRT-3 TaxID=3040349 RepID=UPI0024AEF85C|nr:TonB-dependent receptor [Asticcacaulis sp. EMRT-3]MDI7776396.1 TonB-dependent receptor [Asticcacaulis sp. EMRT-3]